MAAFHYQKRLLCEHLFPLSLGEIQKLCVLECARGRPRHEADFAFAFLTQSAEELPSLSLRPCQGSSFHLPT